MMSQPSNYDLNALKNLFLLYRERSVTKAAKVAGITQPSMSRALNKLRQQYHDRLFVRQKDALVPTLKTEQLMAALAPLFEKIDSAIANIEPLQPEYAVGQFCFAAPDFVSKFAMANLPSGILTITPKIEFSYQYWSHDVLARVQSGAVDLAFGYAGECPNHVKSETISDDRYVLVCRPEHPLVDFIHVEGVQQHEVLKYPYIAVTDSGFSDAFFDRALAAKGLRRQKVVTTPDLVAAFSLLMKADYLMVVPSGLARYLCPECVQYSLPAVVHSDNADGFAYCLYWGAIKDQDPLHQYIRNIIKTSFLSYWPSAPAGC